MSRSIITVGVTLIWQKAVAAIHINSYETILVLFKLGGQTKNRQINCVYDNTMGNRLKLWYNT